MLIASPPGWHWADRVYFYCFIWFSEQTTITFVNSINELIFVTEKLCSVIELRTGYACPLIQWKATLTSRLTAGTAWLTAKRYEIFPDTSQASLRKATKNTYLYNNSSCREPGSESCVELYQWTDCIVPMSFGFKRLIWMPSKDR
jgi:hypothetical protein